MMWVVKYIPERMIGFVNDLKSGSDVYFHLGDFDPKGPWVGLEHTCSKDRVITFNWEAPPPILGEPVEVVLFDNSTRDGSKAPHAQRVVRINPPVHLTGIVESFDPRKGYGFVRGGDGITYYLHRSEMIDQHTPHKGSLVMFFAGSRQGNPRAIHAHICGDP